MKKLVNGVEVEMTALEIQQRQAESAAAANPVPQEVPKWAAEIALIDANMDTLPQAYFASLTGKAKKKAEALWRARTTLRRDSEVLAAAVADDVITASEVDDLMRAAAVIAAG